MLDCRADSSLTMLDCPGVSIGDREESWVGRRSGEAARRAPLSKDVALTCAVIVADAEGLEAVTMRRLARELGVEAASLYHYFSGKDEILDGLVDVVSA